MTNIPKPQEIYRHFKGNLYQIITVAEHTQTGEKLVIYQALYGEFGFFARPLDNFMSEVDHVKYPDCEQMFRFERVKLENNIETKNCKKNTDNKFLSSGQISDREKNNEMQKDTQAKDKKPELTSKETQEGINESTQEESNLDTQEEKQQLDPLLIQFLDADTYEEKLNILAGLHHRITDDMLTTMSIDCNIEIEDSDIEEKYNSLKNCLITLEKFERNRLG